MIQQQREQKPASKICQYANAVARGKVTPQNMLRRHDPQQRCKRHIDKRPANSGRRRQQQNSSKRMLFGREKRSKTNRDPQQAPDDSRAAV